MTSPLEKPPGIDAAHTVRVAVLGSSNVRVLRAALAATLAEFLPDRSFEFYEVPFGQLQRDVLDSDSALHRFQPHLAIFCDRLEDLAGAARLDGAAPDATADLVDRYARVIADFHASQARTIVQRFAMLYRPIDAGGGPATETLVDEMNARLARRLEGLHGLSWIDVATEAAAAECAAVDPMLWHLARLPFSEEFSQKLARRWTGSILAALGRTARVVVLDLDNTLWGGILGEDGLAGLHVGGDYPGNAHAALQRALQVVASRGVALAVCSRNDAEAALAAIDALPGMVIRTRDLVTHRINWEPKWSNIQAIADELNLGLESLLFVDDNPVEREAVRHQLPGLNVLDLPPSPAGYADALANCPWLAAGDVTAEDRTRAESLKTLRAVKRERLAAGSLDDFYAGLKMTVHFQPLDEANAARAVQLSQKTNQFNTTTRRYDRRDLSRIVAEGGDVVVIGLEDRFLPFENIGLIVLTPPAGDGGPGVVDNYLLSCRVLGRGLESAVLNWAAGRAAARGWSALCGSVIDSDRNTPVRTVFSQSGFQPTGKPGQWTVPTSGAPPVPSWICVVDRVATAG